jgi:hypothetical protein
MDNTVCMLPDLSLSQPQDSHEVFCTDMRVFRSPQADNFEREQLGMRVQLAQLREILSVLDRQLYDHMAKHDSLNMFFCFRWLLILFKREFELSETETIWEVRVYMLCSHLHQRITQ